MLRNSKGLGGGGDPPTLCDLGFYALLLHEADQLLCNVPHHTQQILRIFCEKRNWTKFFAQKKNCAKFFV